MRLLSPGHRFDLDSGRRSTACEELEGRRRLERVTDRTAHPPLPFRTSPAVPGAVHPQATQTVERARRTSAADSQEERTRAREGRAESDEREAGRMSRVWMRKARTKKNPDPV